MDLEAVLRSAGPHPAEGGAWGTGGLGGVRVLNGGMWERDAEAAGGEVRTR